MGCDIHSYLEFFDKDLSDGVARCYATHLDFGRCYTTFNLMAGVRGYRLPLIKPRGIPSTPKISFTVSENYHITVVDSYTNCHFTNGRYISREDALTWVDEGRTTFEDNGKYIIDPSWHTPSWLTKDELIEVRRHYLIETLSYESTEYKGQKRRDAMEKLEQSSSVELMRFVFPSIEYVMLNATIASMIAIENSGEYKTRLVFWFDS